MKSDDTDSIKKWKRVRSKIKKKPTSTIERLDAMLEDAISDTFEEGNYDESKLSRLEVKWKRFLTSSVASKRRIYEEQERIKRLISDISHQTKTPLANILLYSQILQEKEKDPELSSIVENIREQSEKLDFLIRNLVKASRLESDALALRPKRQKVGPMIEAAIGACREGALLKQIVISYEAFEGEAFFDRKWTEEALVNLLDNAVKYSPGESEIRIHVSDYEMFTAVHVTDCGIGIVEEEYTKVFERFYRSREAAEEKGLGLGLYLVREIAAKQGGYVKVKSKHGEGSTFSFYMIKDGKQV
ncbi:MAG: HAMP domain-containing histidine kinase [Clostridium sp.]|nr:HAMP domain-containing histidine kinase [Clostridium sp.]